MNLFIDAIYNDQSFNFFFLSKYLQGDFRIQGYNASSENEKKKLKTSLGSIIIIISAPLQNIWRNKYYKIIL